MMSKNSIVPFLKDYLIKFLTRPFLLDTNDTEFIENIYKMIFQYREEVIKLEHLRDTLLPKLMSGELKINNFNN